MSESPIDSMSMPLFASPTPGPSDSVSVTSESPFLLVDVGRAVVDVVFDGDVLAVSSLDNAARNFTVVPSLLTPPSAVAAVDTVDVVVTCVVRVDDANQVLLSVPSTGCDGECSLAAASSAVSLSFTATNGVVEPAAGVVALTALPELPLSAHGTVVVHVTCTATASSSSSSLQWQSSSTELPVWKQYAAILVYLAMTVTGVMSRTVC